MENNEVGEERKLSRALARWCAGAPMQHAVKREPLQLARPASPAPTLLLFLSFRSSEIASVSGLTANPLLLTILPYRSC